MFEVDEWLESRYEDLSDQQYDPFGYDYSDDPDDYDDSDNEDEEDESYETEDCLN